MTKQQYIKRLEDRRKRRAIKRKIKKILNIGLILIAVGIFFSNISFSHTEIKTKTINVSSGETLWEIAKREKVVILI